MREIKLGDLANEQAERGSHALIAYGKPLRRYVKPADKSEDGATQAEANSAPQPDLLDAPRRGRKRRERIWRATPALNLKALGAACVDAQLFDMPLLDENAPHDGFTQEGDVILALAPPLSCTCIGPDEAGAFIPNSCAVIRMDEVTRAMLNPWYLAGFLALPTTQKALQSKRAGGKTALLTIDQVCDLTVLVPDLSQQKLLGEAVRRHAQVEIALKRFRESEMNALNSAYAHILQKDGTHD